MPLHRSPLHPPVPVPGACTRAALQATCPTPYRAQRWPGVHNFFSQRLVSQKNDRQEKATAILVMGGKTWRASMFGEGHSAFEACKGARDGKGSCEIRSNPPYEVLRRCGTCSGKISRAPPKLWACVHPDSDSLYCVYSQPCSACCSTPGKCSPEQLAVVLAKMDRKRKGVVADRVVKCYAVVVAALAQRHGERMFPESELPRLRQGISSPGDRVEVQPGVFVSANPEKGKGGWVAWVRRTWAAERFCQWKLGSSAVRGYPDTPTPRHLPRLTRPPPVRAAHRRLPRRLPPCGRRGGRTRSCGRHASLPLPRGRRAGRGNGTDARGAAGPRRLREGHRRVARAAPAAGGRPASQPPLDRL